MKGNTKVGRRAKSMAKPKKEAVKRALVSDSGATIERVATNTQDLSVINNVAENRDAADERSSTRAPCGFCGGDQMTVVAFVKSGIVSHSRPDVHWLRCISCFGGSVVNAGAINPAAMPLDTPGILKGDDLTAWNEVRACLSAGAYTGAVMMCRKLLFHIAVAHGLPAKNAKDRAPTFQEALDHLETEGVVTKLMLPWVEKIKELGNDANHELPTMTKADAMDIAEFTRQLIRLAYELPAMVAEHAPADADSTETN